MIMVGKKKTLPTLLLLALIKLIFKMRMLKLEFNASALALIGVQRFGSDWSSTL